MAEAEAEIEITETTPCWRRRRYVVVLMAFLGYLIGYTLRTCTNVAIIQMVKITNQTLDNGTVIQTQEHSWDKNEQGLVLSSFYFGYFCTQYIGGYLAMKFGGVLIVGVAILLASIFTLLCPVCAQISIWLLVASRIVIGLVSGPMFPGANAIWARWAPPKEKAFIVSFVFSGTLGGAIVGNAISGVMSATVGWESPFYLFGTMGTIWGILWLLFIRERPRKDRCCSEEETNYIESMLKVPTKVIHPYKAILKSAPFWAVCAAQSGSNWGFYTMLTQYPTFLRNALDFDVKKSGGLSAFPYLFMLLLMNLTGFVSDLLTRKKWLSPTIARKLFFNTSLVIQSGFLIGAVYVTDVTTCVVFMTIAISLHGMCWSAKYTNHVDIGPPHASVVLGITNTFGTVGGIISPIVTGAITKTQSKEEWRVVFFIVIAVYAVTVIIYTIFASAKRQPWAVKTE